MSNEKKSVFEILNAINCNGHTESKNGLTYLSWAWAWAEVKKAFPQATYTIYENANGLFYHTDGRTCWVKTGVTIEGVEMIEFLPVMDFRNASITVDKVTSFDVNKAIQRSLTKACARHGLGLYIYAGEDLPEEEQIAKEEQAKAEQAKKKAAAKQSSPKAKEAWVAFKALDSVKKLDDAGRNAKWNSILIEASGKNASPDLTDDDWEKVFNLISVETVI